MGEPGAEAEDVGDSGHQGGHCAGDPAGRDFLTFAGLKEGVEKHWSILRTVV